MKITAVSLWTNLMDRPIVQHFHPLTRNHGYISQIQPSSIHLFLFTDCLFLVNLCCHSDHLWYLHFAPYIPFGGEFPAFHFIILKSPRMQSDTRSWLISKPLILFSFEENNMDGPKQGIIGRTHGSAWPANNPDPLPRLAASLGNIVH